MYKLERRHLRLPIAMSLTLVFDDTGSSITVQGHDISWGGVRFSAPKLTFDVSDSVIVKLPWAKGAQFSAHAKIVRTESLDDHYDMIAARFSNLSAIDQKRLEKLLEMLRETPEERSEGGRAERPASLVPMLEVFVGDAEEMRSKLAQLAEGHLSVHVVEVEAYDIGHSIRVILSDPTDQPPMRLRARVIGIDSVPLGSDSAWPMFDVKLRIEHPLDELKVAAKSRLKLLSKHFESLEVVDDDSESDNPYLF